MAKLEKKKTEAARDKLALSQVSEELASSKLVVRSLQEEFSQLKEDYL
jgi:hypothetical protein